MNPILKNMLVSWKTSLSGILAGILFVAQPLNDYWTANAGLPTRQLLLGALMVLAGLFARDGDKSSEQSGAKATMLGIWIAILAMPLFLSGCLSSDLSLRNKSVNTAYTGEVARYEAHVANVEAVASKTDAALSQAQKNDFKYRFDERVNAITTVVAQKPEFASAGIQALATAQTEYADLLAQQADAQARFRSIIDQSRNTNLAQARALDAQLRKITTATTFNGAQAANDAAAALAPLIPAHPAATTISTHPVVPTPPVQTPAPTKPQTMNHKVGNELDVASILN